MPFMTLVHTVNDAMTAILGATNATLGVGLLAGIAYVVLGRVQEAVGLISGILIGFSMVVPAAFIALVVLLRGRSQTPVHAH